MSKMYYKFIALVVAVSVVGFAIDVQADSILLFKDNFNGVTNPGSGDYGLNDNLSERQSGYLVENSGTIQWARGISTDGTDNTSKVQVNSVAGTDMLLSYGTGNQKKANNAIIQHNFNYAGGFTVRWDMDPISSCSLDTKHNHSAAIFIGSGDGTQSYLETDAYTGEYDLNNELALSITDQGKLRVRWSDANCNLVGSDVYGGISSKGNYYTDEITYDLDRYNLVGNDSSNYTQMYTFELRVSTTDYAEGTLASAELWVIAKDGFSWTPTVIDLNGDLVGNAAIFHWDSDNANYIGFNMNVDTTAASQFDNVEVYGAVPEPSTIALLATGLIGLLAYAWRKRK